MRAIGILIEHNQFTNGNKYHLEKGSKVGIFFSNKADWIIINQALQRLGLVTVPLYATLGFSSINYILELTEIELIFVASETIDKIDELESHVKQLKFVYLDPQCPTHVKKYTYSTLDLLDDIIELGKKNYCEPDLPNVNDMYAIFFTSGSSGVPKGVVHTHKSFHAAVCMFGSLNMYNNENISLDRTTYSYLPLAHCFDHQVSYIYIYGYGRVAFNCNGI